jgi:hypothetical protein
MSSINHRRSQRHPSYVEEKTVEIGGPDGTTFAFHDWPAPALPCLIEAGEAGIASLDCPALLAPTALSEVGSRSDVVERQLSAEGGPTNPAADVRSCPPVRSGPMTEITIVVGPPNDYERLVRAWRR